MDACAIAQESVDTDRVTSGMERCSLFGDYLDGVVVDVHNGSFA